MHLLATLFIVFAALVNLAPLTGLLSGARMEALYGLRFDDPTLLVLMRHRAILFGLVGGLLLVGAFYPPLRLVGIVCGSISMITFIAIALSTAGVNPAIQRLAYIDGVAQVLLFVAWGIDRWGAA